MALSAAEWTKGPKYLAPSSFLSRVRMKRGRGASS